MKYLKTLSKTLLFTIIFFIFLTLLLTIFNYFNIINYQLLMGKKASKNGWLEGLKISLIIIIILIIITLIINEFSPKKLTYFLILIISGIFGSILGINTKNT